jgi:hypothetical protein
LINCSYVMIRQTFFVLRETLFHGKM